MGDKDHKNKHSFLKNAVVTAAAGTAAYAGASYYCFREIFSTDVPSRSFATDETDPDQVKFNSWYIESCKEDAYLKSYDGLTMHAVKIVNHPESHKWLIPVHGYRSSSLDMLRYMYEADQRGYNLLVPDLRGHGLSEGCWTGMSWPEHYDLISWIGWLSSEDENSAIALFGVSMGASTVLNTIGDYISSNVKCAVSDSGFSDIREILQYSIDRHFNFDMRAVMPGIHFYIKQILHYSLDSVSILQQLKKAKTPVMIIHGENDHIVPPRMAYDCYYALSCEKHIWTLPDTDHVEAYKNPEYFERVFEFIESKVSPK